MGFSGLWTEKPPREDGDGWGFGGGVVLGDRLRLFRSGKEFKGEREGLKRRRERDGIGCVCLFVCLFFLILFSFLLLGLRGKGEKAE